MKFKINDIITKFYQERHTTPIRGGKDENNK